MCVFTFFSFSISVYIITTATNTCPDSPVLTLPPTTLPQPILKTISRVLVSGCLPLTPTGLTLCPIIVSSFYINSVCFPMFLCPLLVTTLIICLYFHLFQYSKLLSLFFCKYTCSLLSSHSCLFSICWRCVSLMYVLLFFFPFFPSSSQQHPIHPSVPISLCPLTVFPWSI